MKTYSLLFATCMILFFSSCEKDTKCVKVKYISSYCPKMGASLVKLEESETSESIALLNVPEAFRVNGKVFYVTYHYDEAQSKTDPQVMCPAIYGPAKIYVADSVDEHGCN
ncbi:MAG: hypothetical protein ACO1NU_00870 [Arcticibacter sp.]